MVGYTCLPTFFHIGTFWLQKLITNNEQQRVIDELQALIDDTQSTLTRFEDTGMDELMPEDYNKLLEMLDNAIKQQREHTLAMLAHANL
ncbi:hypothetical protein MOY_14087 [Halomonas sp. GFAJ-1]|nr:hypothetical protein MOY_14087 [Halomonas sp. GFAJ-1]